MTMSAAAQDPLLGVPQQTYRDPASGRHYTERPDGQMRWLTEAEEATLAWRAAPPPPPTGQLPDPGPPGAPAAAVAEPRRRNATPVRHARRTPRRAGRSHG